ncbi:hypothetical protein PLICRDRAFT_43093 [Plicaturopsis crispa FD-325 SS-3]|nr:hypothetical protein PLICRDRAFT_43093 [Plicaturopsis crispa FD-325 SS-3]
MDSASTSEAALKLEIARLSGAINRHKSTAPAPRPGYPTSTRHNVYVNPNYKPANKYIRPGTSNSSTSTTPTSAIGSSSQPHQQAPHSHPAPGVSSEAREVVLGGVAFQSSGRSLVRKDLPKPVSSGPPKPTAHRPPTSHADFSRTKAGHLIPAGRVYKPKTTSRARGGRGRAGRGGRGRGAGPFNMSLDNNRRPYQSRLARKQLKYSDKPCPRFTTTGACSRGLTCLYQHDPSKIAICWKFLQGNCPNTADTCALSHDPTPERTPLCVHFANNGRCNRDNCPFPHVRVGTRAGVCRDFAVLGYCAKGLDCDQQHVRECPDFAEKGACTTKGCKLPHVIRANRNRKPAISATASTPPATSGGSTADVAASDAASADSANAGTDNVSALQHASAEDAKLGDEYISLTFHESEDSDDDEEEEDEDEDEDDDENAEEESDDSDHVDITTG